MAATGWNRFKVPMHDQKSRILSLNWRAAVREAQAAALLKARTRCGRVCDHSRGPTMPCGACPNASVRHFLVPTASEPIAVADAICREIQAFDPHQRSRNTGARIHGLNASVAHYIAVDFFSQAR